MVQSGRLPGMHRVLEVLHKTEQQKGLVSVHTGGNFCASAVWKQAASTAWVGCLSGFRAAARMTLICCVLCVAFSRSVSVSLLTQVS